MLKRIILLAPLLLLLSLHAALAGGPWPKGKGKTYLKVGEWWVVSQQHYTDNGGLDPNVTTGIFNTFLYAEHGFTERLTATLYFPFVSRTYMNNLVSGTTGEVIVPGSAYTGIGDTDLGAKYTLTKPGAKIPLSLSVILGLPLGNPAAGDQKNLQTGDGELNQMLRLDAAHSFRLGKQNSYVSTYLGVNNRTNGFSDEFRFGVEWGLNLADRKLWLISRLDGVESFFNGSRPQDVSSTSIFANNTEFTMASLEAAYYLSDKIGVSVYGGYAFRGKIIFAAPSFSVGVFGDL